MSGGVLAERQCGSATANSGYEGLHMNNKYWSKEVTEKSNSLDLEEGVFTFNDPKIIAESLKKSAEDSSRKKGTTYQSAMSMLNFYINRAGKNLEPGRKQVLEQAKIELRILFKS